jgi:hypothetical protein
MGLITRLCAIVMFALLYAPCLFAQNSGARVTLTATVSPFVAVSVAPPVLVRGGDALISAGPARPHTVVVSLSGGGGGETEIDVPLRLRSNASFTLAASCKTGEARLSGLSVIEVGGGGKLVYPGAGGLVTIAAMFDGRRDARTQPGGIPDLSAPVVILKGPPISMGGTLDSPDNTIEVVLRLVMSAPPGGKVWPVELEISVAPEGYR